MVPIPCSVTILAPLDPGGIVIDGGRSIEARRVSSLSGVWGGAPAEIDFGAF